MSEETSNQPEINPYQPPHTPAESLVPPPRTVSMTTIALVSVALALGVISLAPYIGIFFWLCAIPVYVRYVHQNDTVSLARSGAAALAGVGVALSVFAASAGAFFGTCHASAFVLILGTPLNIDQSAGIAMIVAPIIGSIAGGLTIWQLWPLTRPRQVVASHERIKTERIKLLEEYQPGSVNPDPPRENGFKDPPGS